MKHLPYYLAALVGIVIVITLWMAYVAAPVSTSPTTTFPRSEINY